MMLSEITFDVGTSIGQLAILITAISSFIVAIRTSGKVKDVQAQVNGNLDKERSRVEQLTQTIQDADGVKLPPHKNFGVEENGEDI